jgi:hypothetical protein
MLALLKANLTCQMRMVLPFLAPFAARPLWRRRLLKGGQTRMMVMLVGQRSVMRAQLAV